MILTDSGRRWTLRKTKTKNRQGNMTDPTDHDSAVMVERPDAMGPFLIVCEHAANTFPQDWGTLGLDAAQRQAHIAWDPGALGVARALSQVLDATLVAATVSRLIYDLNRPPHAAGAMAAHSEIHTIPGNANLSPEARAERTAAIYLPFHARLRSEIALRLARGVVPVLVTVHSFTPVYHGRPRAVELGVIHDADPHLAHAVVNEAAARTTLDVRLNDPYSAADGVTHTLALQATPMGLANVMLEIRNDLIATPEAQRAMAATLADVLHGAVNRTEAA
jgi:predicted N-formylglutamate amidohydrolase